MRHANRWRLLSWPRWPFMTLVGTAGSARAQDKPRYGGELQFVVPSEPPSYDAHREETFGVTHPMSPHYNTLLRVDPFDKTGTKPVGDLAESWTIAKDGLVYTFKLRHGVKFHDGTPMTSRDVKASYDKIIFPPQGIASLAEERLPGGRGGRGPRCPHRPLPAEVAGVVLPAEPGIALELDLQGRHPRQGHALVREERDGHGPLPLRGARQGLALGGQEEPRLLGQGQALPRRLPRHVRQLVLGPGRGGARRAGAHPVPRASPPPIATAWSPPWATRSPSRRAPGTAS